MASITQYVVRHSPRQAQIVNDLLKRIYSNELTPGVPIPSIADLSRHYNASTNTVQRAIVYLRENGYVKTTIHGSKIADNPPHLSHFGIVFPYTGFKSQFHVALEKEAEHISRTASADGFQRRFSIFHDVYHPEEAIRQHNRLMEALAEHTLGGLIVLAGSFFLKDIIGNHADVPCVSLLTNTMPDVPNIRLPGMVGHSLDIIKRSGRKRVAFIIDGRGDASGGDRLIDAANRRGLITHPWWIQGIHFGSIEWADNCMQMVMHGADKPEALIITDDNFVPYATTGIETAGGKVPDDLLVIAHANFPQVTASCVPAIRLGPDVRDIMKTAVETIEAIRHSENVPEQVEMPLYIQHEAHGPVVTVEPSHYDTFERG